MRTLKIKVSSKELNALEDLLFCDLKPGDKRRIDRTVRELWNRLISAWGKPVR